MAAHTHSKERKIIVNREIHAEAQLTKSEFLNRIKNVKYLRASAFRWPLFITGPETFKRVRELYAIVNREEFRLTNSNKQFEIDLGSHVITNAPRSDKFFAIEVEEDLFNWFANTDIGVIQKQIVSWMTAAYIFNHGFIKEFDEMVHPLVLNEIKAILKAHYPENITPYDSFMGLDSDDGDEGYDGEDTTLAEEEKEAKRRDEPDWELYRQACLAHAGSEPVEFLGDPFSHESFGTYLGGGLHGPSITGRVAYMRFDDWTDIVIRDVKHIKALYKQVFGEEHHLKDDEIRKNVEQGETDSLERAESDKTLFDSWYHEYTLGRRDGVGVYSLYDSSPSPGVVYVIQEEHTDRHKIGWTGMKVGENPERAIAPRLAACKTYNAGNPMLAGYFLASSVKAETALHRHFEDQQINREWFSLSQDDVRDILDPLWRKNRGIY
jgi:hypothetical protein